MSTLLETSASRLTKLPSEVVSVEPVVLLDEDTPHRGLDLDRLDIEEIQAFMHE
jgi:hypothetical protein